MYLFIAFCRCCFCTVCVRYLLVYLCWRCLHKFNRVKHLYANVPGAVPRSFAAHCSQQSYRSVSIVSWPLGCADVRFDQFDVLCPTVNSPTFFLAHSRDEDQLTKDIERENIVVAGKKFNANVCGTTVRNVCIWLGWARCA